MSKIDIDKFVLHLIKWGALDVNAVQSSLYAQGLTLCGDTIQEIKEKAPEKIYVDANENWLRTFTAFTDKAKENDIEYVRADTLLTEIERLKSINKFKPKFKIGQRIKRCETIAEIKKISEEGYHCDIGFVPFTAEENWKLSLWDENDDNLLYECKREMWKSDHYMSSPKHEKIEQWLESLKQRLQ